MKPRKAPKRGPNRCLLQREGKAARNGSAPWPPPSFQEPRKNEPPPSGPRTRASPLLDGTSGHAIKVSCQAAGRDGKISMETDESWCSVEDYRLLVLELQIHQVELEMQNEELRLTRAQLKASLGRSTELFELAPVGCVTISRQGLILSANLACSSLLELERSRLIGCHFRNLVLNKEGRAFGDFLVKVFESSSKQLCELPMSTGRGHPLFGRIEARVVGTGQACLAMVVDITERRRLEERLHQLEKMEAIGRLAGGIAHDINNMLGPILGYADMLADKEKDPNLRRYAEVISRAARHAATLTSQILGFARKGKYVVTSVDIHTAISEIIPLLEHGLDSRITIQQQLNAVRPVVIGDSTQISNVLLNLALNARDAMSEGGTLCFATEIVEFAATSCMDRSTEMTPGTYVEIRVSDTGVGMDQTTAKRVFDPFFTTKPEGTGMGLASAYGTVRSHGGRISVKSEPGRGSTFTLLLPVSANTEVTMSTFAGLYAKRGSARILVVDDEQDMRAVAGDMLTGLGYDVEISNNGFDALEIYEKAPRQFDLVLLDMVMPGLSGRETLIRLRKINPNVRVLLSSGYTSEGDFADIATPFVSKPYAVEELSWKIWDALDSHHPPGDSTNVLPGANGDPPWRNEGGGAKMSV